MQDLKDLERVIQLVKDDLLRRLPGVPHTITILLWDDNTSRVECRHGDGTNIHTSTYYNGNVEYKVEPMLSGSMMTTSDGHRYFLKDSDSKEDLSDTTPSPDMEVSKNPCKEIDSDPGPALNNLLDCKEIRRRDIPTLTNPKTVRLIEFDVLNLNQRIYTKEVIEPLLEELNEYPIYGEIGNGEYNISLDAVACKMTNIRIEGRFLKGDVQFTDTPKGRELLEQEDNYVFRSRAQGNIKDNYVVSIDILSFDAIHKDIDAFAMEDESELEMLINNLKAEVK